MSYCFGNQITLGELIRQLETLEQETVIYDFCSLAPTTLDSYRGFYDHLALGHTIGMAWPEGNRLPLIEHLKSAIGKTFTGYKGGDYTMRADTPVWVANPGATGSTAIVGVKDRGHYLEIQTETVEC